MSVVGVVAVIVGVLFSIAVHEFAHLLPAKLFRVPVPAYSVGFGSVLWRKQVGETSYRVSAIPLGGYVRIAGMYAPAEALGARKGRASRSPWVEDARHASAELIPPGRERDAFYLLAPWKKITVMFAGPLSNLVLAAVFMSIALVGIGHPVPSPTLSQIPATIPIADTQVPSPAAAAGIEQGDTILRVGETKISSWPQISDALKSSDGAPVEVQIRRGGQSKVVMVTPVFDPEGSRWVLGVQAGVAFESSPWSAVPEAVGGSVVGVGQAVLSFPAKVWEATVSMVTGAERDPNGAISLVGVARIGGQMTQAPSEEASPFWHEAQPRMAVAGILLLLGSINIALFVFNMVPLPPLDGGHIISAIYEALRNRLAALRGKPTPPPVDTARLVPLSYAIGALLLVAALLLMVADLVNPISLR